MMRRVISISIDEDIVDCIDSASRMCNMSKSRFIENLLIKALDASEVKGDNENE